MCQLTQNIYIKMTNNHEQLDHSISSRARSCYHNTCHISISSWISESFEHALGLIRDLCIVINREKRYQQNGENLMQIGRRIRKLIWHVEVSQIFTNILRNIDMNNENKLVSWWCHCLTILNLYCTEDWIKIQHNHGELWCYGIINSWICTFMENCETSNLHNSPAYSVSDFHQFFIHYFVIFVFQCSFQQTW